MIMDYNEKERVYNYILQEGRQASVQVSVGLNIPFQTTEKVLEELVSEKRIKKVDLPRRLRNLHEASDKPRCLYEANIKFKVAPIRFLLGLSND